MSQEIFFTSDMHFGHARIIELAYRPFDTVEDMNEALVDNWNTIVTPDDLVWVLGDAVMGHRHDTLGYIERLNGTKMLIPGNHDYVHPMHGPKFDKWIDPYVDSGFVRMPVQMQFAPNISMCHFPFTGDHTDEERYVEWRPKDDGQWLIHGHVHDMWKINGRQINVGVDVWDFTPVHVDTIMSIVNGG